MSAFDPLRTLRELPKSSTEPRWDLPGAREMSAHLGFASWIIAVSASAAQPQPGQATSELSLQAGQSNEIIVEAQRLSKELKNTILTLVRGRDQRATFKLKANGTFISAMNGQQSDFGKWHVEGDTVCFE